MSGNNRPSSERNAPGRPAIRIVLVDDHNLFRQGIAEMLATSTDLVVLGEGTNGREAVALAVAYQPDVLLLDVEMPASDAGSVIRQVRRTSPDTQVVVLTMHDDADIVRELLDCGAAAYLLKTILRDELVAAVRSVSRSRDTVPLSVSRRTLERLDQHGKSGDRTPLTERERDVLQLAAQALSNAQIAARLHITEATVKRHLTNVYAKLNAVSRVDAIRKATAANALPDPREWGKLA